MNDPHDLEKDEKKQIDEQSAFSTENSATINEHHASSRDGSSSPEKKKCRGTTRLVPIVTTPKRGISGASSSDDDDLEEEDDDGLEGSDKRKIPSFHNSQGTPVQARRTTGPPTSDASASSDPSNSTDASTAGASVSADQERQILLLMLLAQVCALHDPTPRTFTVHVLELFERGILGRQSIHFLFELGLVPSNTPRLLPPSTTALNNDDSKEEVLDLAKVAPSTPTPSSPQTLRAQEASAIRSHLEHLDLAQEKLHQDRQNARANLFHHSSTTTTNQSTLVESPKAASTKPHEGRSSWAVEHHPLSLSRYQREFHQVRLLNAGSFGEVFQSTNKIDLRDYAVKRVAFSAWGYSKDSVSQVIREVHCLAQCDHPNVVRYYTSWLEPSWMTGSGATTTNMITSGATHAEVRRQQKLLTDINHMMMVSGGEEASSFSSQPSATNDNENTVEDAALLRTRKFSIGSSMDSQSFDSAGSSYDETSSSDDGEEDDFGSWSADNTTNREDSILFASSTHEKREAWESSSSPSRPAHGRTKKKEGNRIKYRYQICLFIQMQLCHPATLGDWIRHRNAQCPDPNQGRHERVEGAVKMFTQIVGGLTHVHGKGVVHRDLKPHNLFRSLEDEGAFLIGDFGLSKLIHSATHQPKKNQHSPVFSSPTDGANNSVMVRHQQAPIELTEGVGTASYAAPEQVTTKTYGKPADIFSLGLILLEMMSCFTTEHERMQTFYDCRHRRDIPSWIAEVYPTIAKVILDCTNPNPAKRPTAEELLALDLLESPTTTVGSSNDEVKVLKLELEAKNEEILGYQKELKEKDQAIAKLQAELAHLRLHRKATTMQPAAVPGIDSVHTSVPSGVEVESSSSSEDGV